MSFVDLVTPGVKPWLKIFPGEITSPEGNFDTVNCDNLIVPGFTPTDCVTTTATLTTNYLLKGTGSKTVAPSNIQVDGSNNVTGVQNLQVNSIVTCGGITSPTGLIIQTPSGYDLQVDAQGSGRIKINNLEGNGIVFGVNSTASTVPVVVAPDGDITKDCLILFNQKHGSTHYSPCIAAQKPGVAWAPIRIGTTYASTVLSSDPSTNQSVYTGYNTFLDGTTNFRNGNIYVGGNLLCDTSRNITCGTINGQTLGSSAYASYGRNSSVTYTWSASSVPQNLQFNVTDVQSGVTIGGASDQFTVGSTGIYEFDFSGYITDTSTTIDWVRFALTKNGTEITNQVVNLKSAIRFDGWVGLNRQASLTSGDVMRITILTSNTTVSVDFVSLVLGDSPYSLTIRKI